MPPALPLATTFVTARRATSPVSSEVLERELAALHQAGREAWPTCDLAATDLAKHLATLVADEATELPRGLFAADLYLACAAARGDVHAVAEVARQLRAIVPSAVVRIDRSPAFADELLQMMLEHLLVARLEAPPRIAEYRGTGPLGVWLRISIVRSALRLREREARARPVELDVDQAPASTTAVENVLARRAYAPAFATALRAALDALDSRPREVLRLHHVEGRTIDELAAHYGIHRATAARWIVAARVEVIEETKRRVREALRIPDVELEGLVHLVVSQLDISISRLR